MVFGGFFRLTCWQRGESVRVVSDAMQRWAGLIRHATKLILAKAGA